ncbi:serine carboxypeptidase-like 1 [Magnolia sinica]|uniref:serine carboxypeptidase-like 1 n=1 Tax=Magnolia sinica TaxID=86752 RepID=UPI002658A82C|nr:serine carboxypeptidase-like 1 [Magnolia sinica]
MLHPITFCLLVLISVHPWPAISRSVISSLPGFPGPLPFYLETGYVGVGESNEDQLFYYFVESENNPKEDPLVVWITGGPGCSAWSGLTFEIGPLYYENEVYNGSVPTMGFRQDSWAKVASIIFLDSPVWTGFSYSSGSKDGKNGDIRSSKEVHEFLKKWLNDHPQFLSNPLYVGGDSYSGITVPIIVQEISNAIEAGQEPILNLKGYLLGNPGTDPKYDGSSRVPFLHGVGIISDELYEATKKSCKGDYTNPTNPQCAEDLQAVNECTIGLNTVHILEPLCFFASPKPKVMEKRRSSLEEDSRVSHYFQAPFQSSDCRSYGYLLSYYWANNERVQKAIHIRKASVKQWQRCNYGINYEKDVHSSLKYHLNLTTKGYRALIYSGDHDMSVPHIGTQAWIRSLNFSIVDDWRSWSVDGQIAGYTRTYSNNLTFATVKGGGHTAPEYKPKECLAMVQRWISHNRL